MAKIKSIEHFRVLPRWLFVKIHDEEGHSGWGEATLEGHTQAVEGCLDALRARLLGYEAKYLHPKKPEDPELTADSVISNISGRQLTGSDSTEVAPS